MQCDTWTFEHESQTVQWAQRIARTLFAGCVIALDGDLGAGKTTWTQAVAREMGITTPVRSPTFALIHEYEEGRLPLYHMDMYRLTQVEASTLGLDDYFAGEGVCIVEWASKIPLLLPAQRLHLYFSHVHVEGEPRASFRRVHVQSHGERYASWCQRWAEEPEERTDKSEKSSFF